MDRLFGSGVVLCCASVLSRNDLQRRTNKRTNERTTTTMANDNERTNERTNEHDGLCVAVVRRSSFIRSSFIVRLLSFVRCRSDKQRQRTNDDDDNGERQRTNERMTNEHTDFALSSFVVRRSSFVVRRSSFVVRRSSFVCCRSLVVVVWFAVHHSVMLVR